jgi:hypothetical protein
MRTTHYSNILFYFTIIGLYIYEPVLGALGQMGLGIFQFVLGMKLIDDIKKHNTIGHKSLKIYLYLLLVWLIVFMIFLFTEFLKPYTRSILYIIPMLIGLYFIVVTYLIYKNHKS